MSTIELECLQNYKKLLFIFCDDTQEKVLIVVLKMLMFAVCIYGRNFISRYHKND